MSRGELLERTLASIPSPDLDAAAETARLLDAKTKPPGSLGRLEDLACRLAAIRGSVPSEPRATSASSSPEIRDASESASGTARLCRSSAWVGLAIRRPPARTGIV